MELELTREYRGTGTNGVMKLVVCHTLELPWRDNERNVSCIPEGRYELRKGMSQKHGVHIRVRDVPGREGILLHPGNHAERDLKGCIAPVLMLTGPGRGMRSRIANDRLLTFVAEAWRKNEPVFLNIKSNDYDNP
jgi:hypothetical protein